MIHCENMRKRKSSLTHFCISKMEEPELSYVVNIPWALVCQVKIQVYVLSVDFLNFLKCLPHFFIYSTIPGILELMVEHG